MNRRQTDIVDQTDRCFGLFDERLILCFVNVRYDSVVLGVLESTSEETSVLGVVKGDASVSVESQIKEVAVRGRQERQRQRLRAVDVHGSLQVLRGGRNENAQ